MSSRTLSPRRRKLLAAMGIDVWVRRRARAGIPIFEPGVDAVSPPAPSETVPRESHIVERPQSSAVAPSETSIAASPATGDDAVRIDLVALAGSGAVVVGRFDTPAERRLGQGVFRAAAGSAAEPTMARFVWPPSSSIGVDAGAAASAYGAFLKGQLDRASGTCLVLLGDAATAPLGRDGGRKLPVPVVRGPAVLALTVNPEAKKALWRSIAAAKRR